MAQALMNQQHFFCVHKKSEVLLKTVKAEVINVGKDPLIIMTFECPECHHQILYKIAFSDLKQLVPSVKNPLIT